jgi:hypothetical protein
VVRYAGQVKFPAIRDGDDGVEPVGSWDERGIW